MGKHTRTETACLAAAAACLTLALSVGYFTANTGGQVEIAPADRSQSIWILDGPAPSPRAAGENIDINSADAQTLALLPEIGDVLASRILQYREENGAFGQIEDIMDISGIGRATFDKIKDYITAEAPA